MSSGLFTFPIINYTGSLPGIYQGAAADMPAASWQVGDWYLQIDTQLLFRWTGTVWVQELSNSGGGGTPSLQAVTAVGNTTNIAVEIDNTLTVAGNVLITNTSGSQNILELQCATGNASFLAASENSTYGYPVLGLYYNQGTPQQYGWLIKSPNTGNEMTAYDQGGADQLTFLFPGLYLSGFTEVEFRPVSATTQVVAYLTDLPHGNYANGSFTGATITIPHGLGYTPTFASVSPKNADTGHALIAGAGYYLTYTSSNIVITLSTTVVVAISLNIDWSALQ